MRKFKNILGTKWKSDDGVMVDSHFDHEMMSYESNGCLWTIPYEYGSDKVYMLYANKGAIRKRSQDIGSVIKVDASILQQIREDLITVLQAEGIPANRIKCFTGQQQSEKARMKFKINPYNERKYESEDGATVFINDSSDRVIYEWNGGRWLIPITEQRVLAIDLTYKEGACGISIEKAIRQQIHEDLIEAWKAGLFPTVQI